MTLDGSAWVDRSITEVWDRVANVVPESWMPKIAVGSTRPKKYKHVEEYGCGHYGCVMPTNEPGLVCKLTSDVTEARFVVKAITLGHTAGIVEYKNIYALQGLTRSSGWGNKRPLFILWRTEAESVGEWRYRDTHPRDANTNYGIQVERVADSLLSAFLRWASLARDYIQPRLRAISLNHHDAQRKQTAGIAEHKWGMPVAWADPSWLNQAREEFLKKVWKAYETSEAAHDMPMSRLHNLKGLPKVGTALRTCLYIAQEMSGNPSLYRVGEALAYYLEEGILLADVHANNLGLDAEGEVIITDPGHAVEIHPRWSAPATIVEI